jgi:hypothetical protein
MEQRDIQRHDDPQEAQYDRDENGGRPPWRMVMLPAFQALQETGILPGRDQVYGYAH